MAEDYAVVKSLIWMLERLLERKGFSYDDWRERFRESTSEKPARSDRTFYNHLRLLREDLLPVLNTRQALTSEEGQYKLAISLEESSGFSDTNMSNFLPLLHALNDRSSLVPFPAISLEEQLRKFSEVPSKTLERIIYKSTFAWRFDRNYLNEFLNAIHQETCLFVEPEGEERAPLEVEPLFLVNVDGAWHLLAQRRSMILQYNLSRVKSLRATDTPSSRRSGTELQVLRKRIELNWGASMVFDPENVHPAEKLTIRYRGSALRYARERFDSQLRQPNDPWFERKDSDGEIEITFMTDAYYEAVSECLRWGCDAEAVSPPDFRQAWIVKLKGLSEMLASISQKSQDRDEFCTALTTVL
ncbi:MAG: WYL domain-containing protein [Spirochaetales bacterium]|nr:WYL domain-containing protein [Spirochaetales bacterium]